MLDFHSPTSSGRHQASDSVASKRPVATSSLGRDTLDQGEVVMKRRDFLRTASLLGAALAFRLGEAMSSTREWRERRDLYPEGVASGDPHPDSVLLWTRRPPVNGDTSKRLTLEVAEDEHFTRVIASTRANLTEASDWTCRVLAAGLKPARVD